MAEKKSIILTLSIDVEEEGLFKGEYQCFSPSTENLSWLYQIKQFIDKGVKPTLFCAYATLANTVNRHFIEELTPYVEIGAHLHHWNTEPLIQNLPVNGILKSVPAAQVPLSIMEKKLKTLLKLCSEITKKPVTSFRMGRWDLHSCLFPSLIRYGIKCDASVRPFHCGKDAMHGPNHFSAPSDPYWIKLKEGKLLEVPLTAVPISKIFNPLKKYIQKSPFVRSTFHKWGLLTLLPIEHPLWLLKLTTKMHLKQGGHVCSLTWHSSEMMPGGTPHLTSKRSIERFLEKIFNYLDWLETEYKVSYMSVGELYNIKDIEVVSPPDNLVDWC